MIGAAGDVTEHAPEVRASLEEGHRHVDDVVELVERGEITLGGSPQRIDQFGAPSGERLGQQVLLVVEEQVDGGGGEA
jgi:hypothetical protein